MTTPKPAFLKTYAQKILIIEDDPIVRQGVNLFLRAEGYDVNEARDRDEAYDLLDKFRFDLVLSDVHSPRLQGMVSCHTYARSHQTFR